jgi:Rrf2 family protein
MNISVKGEYALQAIFDLAANAGPDPVKIAEIARRQNIPQKFLELILASLKQGGFVESRRGAEGGYLLARRAEAISVGDVLRFVEGRQNARASASRQTPLFPTCGDGPTTPLTASSIPPPSRISSANGPTSTAVSYQTGRSKCITQTTHTALAIRPSSS